MVYMQAFDKLEWSFIRMVLIHFSFPSELISLIMSCVSSTFVFILFNGEKLAPFKFCRGLRQGTPFSLYLFILRLEYLGLLIQGQLSLGFWKPVKASQLGPAFSHLFFADDLILFTHATLSNADVINEVFTKFCHI